MDTSEVYIKMCEQANELQALRVPIWGFCNFEMGDVFYKGEKWNRVSMYVKLSEDQAQPTVTETIWLPRQDQLQEYLMKWNEKHTGVEGSYVSLVTLMTHWLIKGEYVRVTSTTTLEQIWLMYVMETIYRKQWNYTLHAWMPLREVEVSNCY